MATGKIDTDLAVGLGLCWSQEQCEDLADKKVGGEYTVDELLLSKHIEYDDAMYAVCRTEITPAAVLRDFATLVAKDHLATVTKGLRGARAFIDAVDFLSAGDADEHPETLAEHAEQIQKFMVSALVIEGPGDYDKPEKVAAYENLLASCKAVRAATKSNPGEAAYGAAHWAYKTAKGAQRDKLGAKHRGQLARIFKDSA